MIRSLSGEASAQIRDWQFFHKSTPVDSIAPHLSLENLKASWAIPRGVLDGIALRLRYSNTDLHTSLTPEGMIESLIFEVLEQIRVESNCPDELKGSQENIQKQFIAWMQQFITNGGAEGSIGLLLITIFSTVWMKLNSKPIPQLMQDIVEATRAGIAENMGPLLVKLIASRNDQAAYAQTTHEVIKLVSGMIAEEYRNNPSIRTKRKNQSATHLKIEWVPPHAGKISADFKSPASHLNQQRRLLKKSLDKYHIYNSSYDIQAEAKKKIRPAQLAIYQEQLNAEIAKQNIPWAKLTRIYQQIFSSQLPNRWETTEAEGLLDRRYLTRAATSPLQSPLYKQIATSNKANTRVTLLVDCSGSMKEQRIKIATCVDALVRILEQAGIKTEVLGYSTVTWQGGRPFKEWRKNGQPPNPGRLNERAHWIFKDFATGWRRARAGIAALLRPEIYAESVDGEALIWAAERLQMTNNSHQTKNLLILFSDGCPMDRATIEANGEHFLKNHLIHAIEWCEKHANLDLWGCGIGEELRPYFANRLSWDAEGDLAAKCLMNWAKELKNTKL